MINREQVQAHFPREGTHYDVIVCGGGPAGFGAAMASAHAGAKTLLLEARAYLGGVAATSLWMPMNRLKLHGKSRGGVHGMLCEKLESFGTFGARPGKTTWTDGDGLHVHPDYLKLAMMELLEEAGCDYRLNSPVAGAVVEEGALKGVRILTKRGLDTFTADVFVDCTGDGDLCFYAGADMREGREEDGVTMPVTLGFTLAGVDEERLFTEFYDQQNCGDMVGETILRAEAEGYTVAPWYSFDRTTIPGVVSVNNGGMKNVGKLNALNPDDATFGERAGIQIAVDFVRFARKYKLPGLENCYLDRTGAAIGVRETRRAMGDYVLTFEDAQSKTDFPDPVAKRYGAVDQAGLGDEDGHEKPKMRSGHTYPYRALHVKGVDRLLVAGRCGSYTHMALAAGKSMGNMMAIGQAAGVTAALSSKNNVCPRELPYEKVKEVLRELQVNINEESDW